MIKDVLELNGISEDILKELSYKSKLGKSLKQNLHAFARDDLLAELYEVSRWLNQQEILSDMVLDYRVKSYDSITQKYERYYPNRQVRQVFNDILGFRAFCDGYEDVLAAVNVPSVWQICQREKPMTTDIEEFICTISQIIFIIR